MELHEEVRQVVNNIFKGEVIKASDPEIKEIKKLVKKGESTEAALKEINSAIEEQDPPKGILTQLNKLKKMLVLKGGSRKTKRRHNTRRNRTQKNH